MPKKRKKCSSAFLYYYTSFLFNSMFLSNKMKDNGVINITSPSLEVQLNQPGGHPLSWLISPMKCGDLLFLVQKMHHLHLQLHNFTSHLHLINQFGSPAEPAWGPSPKLVNLPMKCGDLLFLVQKMHHLHLQLHNFISHLHLIKQFGSPAEPAWGPSPKLG